MKPSRILPLTLLFVTATVFGQNLAGDCPVGLRVDHSPSFQERQVDGGPRAGIEQQIHLTMTNLHPQRIASVQFRVHGLSQKPRFLDVSTPAPDMVKTIRLALPVDGNGQGSSDLRLSRFAVVTAVDVNEVTYADGSNWHESRPAACTVIPSALMRVSAAR